VCVCVRERDDLEDKEVKQTELLVGRGK
jgi:hypothetical protein